MLTIGGAIMGTTEMKESTTSSLLMTGLTHNTSYVFTVTALNGVGWSPWSAWSSWTLVM